MTRPFFVSGYFGFGNLGDEAILEGVVSELRRRDPSVQLVVTSGNPEETAKRYGVSAVGFFETEQIGELISRSRAVLFGLGGVFQDYWGAYASNLFRGGTNGIEAYARPAMFARLYGVPSVLFCGGIGPLQTRDGRALFALACRYADGVTVRDEESADEVEAAGYRSRPVVAADPAFLLSESEDDQGTIREKLKSVSLETAPFVVFSLRPWEFEATQTSIADAAGAAASVLPAGWRALFVPFDTTEASGDVELARTAAARSGGRGEVMSVTTVGQAIALMGRARLTVGMRLHATILSACGGTPSVPIVYSPKVASAAQRLGLGELCVPVSDLSRLRDALGKAIAGREQLGARIAAATEDSRILARGAFDILEALLEEPRPGGDATAAPIGNPEPLLEEAASGANDLRRLIAQRHRRSLSHLRYTGSARESAAESDEAADEEARARQIAENVERAASAAAREKERVLRAVQQVREQIEAARAEAQTLRRELEARSEAHGRELEQRKSEYDAALTTERREKMDLGRALSDTRQELTGIHHMKLWKMGVAYWDFRRRVARTAEAVTGPIRRAGNVLRRTRAIENAAAIRIDARGAGEDAPPSPCPIAAANRHDVVCFPIIDWDFRFQRPQQLMSRFARAGHRVFYVAQRFRPEGPAWQTTRKAENVWEVSLRGPERNVYRDMVRDEALEELWRSLDAMRRDLGLGATASVLQLPFWWPLAERARSEWAWPVVYDCMDHHAGFSTNEAAMLDCEDALLRSADLVLASSSFLERETRAKNGNVLVVRNACDFDHFAPIARQPSRRGPRPVVGYYGAISDWFDSELVADLAERRTDWDFVLVGSTFGADLSRLGTLPNVTLAGEKPYVEIPSWLAGFDVAFIPFRRIPLTEATNPVKAYEIFAAGKPLVAVPLPEIAAMAPHVRLASTAAEFEREIVSALEENPGDRPARERRAFAEANTWEKRFESLAPAIARAFHRVSIVIVTYNNLALNRLCLESVFGRTEWPNFEVFAVDNASSDGTLEYLSEAEKRWPNLRVIANSKNWGFATANNQGLKESTGDDLILLNNDTVVSRGWATALVRHLAQDPKLGLIGPMTNEIGNEAKVEVGYRTLAEMPAWAGEWARAHDGETFPIPMLAMFCVALRRDTLEKVGLLDERFGIGMFEDDDYTRRLRMAGYDIRCARDSFVHHAGRASFKLLGDKKYFEIFEQNRALYQEKWGEMWEPHLDDLDRQRIPGLTARLAEIQAEAQVPPEKVVVFLPSIGWNTPLLQRPHHLAAALARKGWLVIFDCAGSVIDAFADFVKVEKNLYLYKGPRGVLETLARPVVWALPYNVAKASRLGNSVLVYDVIDDLSVFPYNQETLRKNHERALSDADLVLCVARPLLEETRRERPDALYVANAVEYERFAEPKIRVDLDPAFRDLIAAGRPIAGYYGAFASWFDIDLLAAVARERTDWSFVVIAKRLNDAPPTAPLENLGNVRVLDPKPYVELPRYLEKFTAAMIPFRVNEITRSTSPLKMYEYFAAGKPVIATPMPECEAFPEVQIVRDPASFSSALDASRRQAGDPDSVARLRQIARENSWAARIDLVADRLSAIENPRRTARQPVDEVGIAVS